MNNNLYNNVYETAIRVLLIVDNFKRELRVKELIYFDYLMIYIKEVDKNAMNICPANPGHKISIYSRRKLVIQSLNLLILKGLINCSFKGDELVYSNNYISNKFLEYFESEYYYKLNNNAKLIYNKFSKVSLDELDIYMRNLLLRIDDEYDKEPLFRRGYFEL